MYETFRHLSEKRDRNLYFLKSVIQQFKIENIMLRHKLAYRSIYNKKYLITFALFLYHIFIY